MYQSSHVYQDCTNSVPIVKNDEKQSKDSVKQQKMTIGVPIVTESAEYTKPRKLRYLAIPPSHVPGQWPQSSPVGRADCMCHYGRPCVWLSFAAACCYTLFYLLMMPAARLVCQRPSSNFSIFSDPTRKHSALPPELRRIR